MAAPVADPLTDVHATATGRARLAVHRFGLPVIAAFLLTLFAVSVRDGFPDLVEAVSTPVLAVLALATSGVAWARGRASTTLERVVLGGALAVLVGGALESAVMRRMEIGYPYVLGFVPLGYTAAFLLLGPLPGTLVSLATFAGIATATLLSIYATGELHLARGLPVLAAHPILIGLLYTLAWSMRMAARAHLDAEVAASTDALTGSLNRRSGESGLDRQHGPFAILVVDLDDFKQVNDARGHAFGDDVLVRVATALRDSVRPDDLVIRWGGDEFVVVAPTTRDASAPQLVARVRRALADLRDADGCPIGASVGVAVREGHEPWSAVFARADAAMYRVKAARDHS